jgi:hypothetical protein
VTDDIQGPDETQGHSEDASGVTIPLLEVMRHAEKVIARLRSRVAQVPSFEAPVSNTTPPDQSHGRKKGRRRGRRRRG